MNIPLSTILLLIAQYGPDVIDAIKKLVAKKDATIEDVEAVFSKLKPYAAFGIPDVAPTVPK